MSMYFFSIRWLKHPAKSPGRVEETHLSTWKWNTGRFVVPVGVVFLWCIAVARCLWDVHMYFYIEIGFSMFHLSHVHLTSMMCFPFCNSPALLCTWSFCRLLRWVKMFLLCQSDQQTLQNAANSTGTGQGTKDRPCLKVARLGINGLEMTHLEASLQTCVVISMSLGEEISIVFFGWDSLLWVS